MDSPSRRKTYDFPKPEAGLAEWTSRIKELQREVDADEEVEQRRLEDEIRASRLARSRRSGGSQFAGKVDFERSGSPGGYGARSSESPGSPGLSATDNRQRNQSDALRKLTGETAPPIARKPSSTPSMSSSSTPGSKPEPMSLAAFMGGRATGPRLNRPAVQPDAHDPTLFEQRTRADIAAPHPLFGTGGVALAGLASKGREVVNRSDVSSRDAKPAPSWTRDRTVSTPQVVKTIERQPSPASVVSQGGVGVRGRVESLYGNRPAGNSSTPPLRSAKSIEKFSPPLAPVTPAKSEGLRKPSSTQEFARRVSPSPSQSSQASSLRSVSISSSNSSPVTAPSLARPMQPQLRSPSTIVPTSKNASPAFLKPPQQKDLTPSLSRLQGRGFVQSLVKLSSEIEAASSVNTTPERSVTPKKSTVLDRWQPQNVTSLSPTPVSAPLLRKAKTMESQPPRPPSASGDRAEQKRPVPPPKSHSVPDEVKAHITGPKKIAPQDTGGLGSSNTLLSFMKPNKTGENPPTDHPERPKSRNGEPIKATNAFEYGTDDFGVRPRTKSTSSAVAAAKAVFSSAQPTQAQERLRTKSELATVPSGRPLSHPTKDRARLRRKGTASHTVQGSETITTAVASDHRDLPGSVDNPKSQSTGLSQKAVESPKSQQYVASHSQTEEATTTSSTQSSSTRGDNIRRLQDTWANQGPIGVKPLRKPTLPSPTSTNFEPSWANNNSNKRALPGLVAVTSGVSPPSPPLTPPLTAKQDNKPPSSPVRPRIPSSGSRPTVMDVAQNFNKGSTFTPEPPKSPVFPRTSRSPIISEFNAEDPGGWGEGETSERTITPAFIKAERRRSNYEKYSNFTLPVLPEEKTPAPSPMGTLTKTDATAFGFVPSEALKKDNDGQEMVASVQKGGPPKEPQSVRPSKVYIDAMDDPVPHINVAKLWSSSPPVFNPNPDLRTVSVEIMNVDGGSTTEIPKGPDNIYVFYEEETLAIVHRAKSRSSGLVATKVWCWHGRRSETGETEDKKLQELAKRYGTSLLNCSQCGESQELLHLLGGTLIIRQGKRSLWSEDNTTMHRARSWSGLILIDEVDLHVKHLCSGYSYCVSVLDTLWVWYGCGSVQTEREAAKRYSQHLGSDKNIVEVEEGQEDEMFWMFLGDEGYANANYWKWKKQAPGVEKNIDPRIWRVSDAGNGGEIQELETFPAAEAVKAVVVLHLAYEVFVLVGSLVRGSRREIALGLTFAQELSQHTSRLKPFRPPVHVLILPSRIPLDISAAVRGLVEEDLNASEVPDHMNLLSLDEAWQQLRRREWDQKDLEDTRMMPLGLAPTVT